MNGKTTLTSAKNLNVVRTTNVCHTTNFKIGLS